MTQRVCRRLLQRSCILASRAILSRKLIPPIPWPMTVYPPLFPCRTPAQDCQKEVVKNHILHFLLPHQHRFYLERPSGLIFRCSIHWYLFDEEPVTNFPSHQTQTPVTGSWRGWAMAVRHIVAFWMWLLCLHKWIGGTSSGTKMKLVMTSDRKNRFSLISTQSSMTTQAFS